MGQTQLVLGGGGSGYYVIIMYSQNIIMIIIPFIRELGMFELKLFRCRSMKEIIGERSHESGSRADVELLSRNFYVGK